ncbi:hypothetical protein U879_19695 [Defluviimonas sp. 20V17]|uniref:DUF2513 domain-containing protein n=2 Tax=Allgaiera indica TaxID=765699 RepID=A0AAN4UTF5_9RHOB|nr:hypothetical protein U879_19695 [Defluviimonas sp. 20V17]GHE03333.1 hypothetical protein GCM10008024_26170 [Allgaiera indica]SDX23536.1 Hypothetical protein SAMN05444006_11256 [Allgaiera indica]
MEFEAAEDWLIVQSWGLEADVEQRKRQYHILLLCDAGLMTQVAKSAFRLTSSGHDYLQAIRNEGVWAETKKIVADTGGNATLEILKALAIGFLKKQISDRTGFDI